MLENYTPPTKLKLSALWTSTMFCYVYGDHFSLFLPNYIQKLIDGKTPVGTLTPLLLLAFAVLMSIPSVMIALSLFLKPVHSRWANIAFGAMFTLIMMADGISSITVEWSIFYTFFAVVEIALTSAIVRVAWKWQTVIQK